MKIDNKRLFIADIFEAEGYTINVMFSDGMGTKFGGYDYKPKQITKSTVMVKIGCCYVPAYYIKGIFSYLDVRSHECRDGATCYPDERFYSTSIHQTKNDGFCFLKNITPLKASKGKTSLKELHQIQKVNYENDPYQHGGMETAG